MKVVSGEEKGRAPVFDLAEVRARTRDYFDAAGARYLELFRDELEAKPFDRALLGRFAAGLGPGARVCDAGCGPCGHVTRLLAGHGLVPVGIDLSERCIELAREAHPGLAFEVMDMLAMRFGSGSLDGLVACYALPYVPKAHIPALLAEFRRVLRPGGHLLVVAKEGEGEGYLDDPMGSGLRTFFASFTESELKGLVEANGFTCTFSVTRAPYPEEYQVGRIFLLAERGA